MEVKQPKVFRVKRDLMAKIFRVKRDLMCTCIKVKQTAAGVASFDFAELCGTPSGAADFLAIARAFHTVILHKIPGASTPIPTCIYVFLMCAYGDPQVTRCDYLYICVPDGVFVMFLIRCSWCVSYGDPP